jgi:pantoate--beta-alanine ligase
MEIIQTVPGLRQQLQAARQGGQTIGFVPTMGALHEGHLSLVRIARDHADVVVVSIFVNPTQFGPTEDVQRYPRPFTQDVALCAQAGVDILFHPSAEEMYAADASVHVEETVLSAVLCGARRPGHFCGVATVVAKLFNIVQPHTAVFGQKDFQQVRVVQRLVQDLNFPVDIIVAPIVREADGLARSSRNAYLTPSERQAAACIPSALAVARRLVDAGEHNAAHVVEAARETISAEPLAAVEYLEIVDRRTLRAVATADAQAILVVAVRIGQTRLIDNLPFGAEAALD